MPRSKQLESYSTAELVQELKRRFAEVENAKALLAGQETHGLRSVTGKDPKRSASKAAYWKDWHAYKAKHPTATVELWRAHQRKGK